MRFKVLVGIHSQNGINYGPKQEAGALVECAEPLDKIFGAKFARLEDAEKKAPAKKAPKSKNANSLFDNDPVETGLNVMQTGKAKFDVYDVDDETNPLNDAPLSKSTVPAFLASQLEG